MKDLSWNPRLRKLWLVHCCCRSKFQNLWAHHDPYSNCCTSCFLGAEIWRAYTKSVAIPTPLDNCKMIFNQQPSPPGVGVGISEREIRIDIRLLHHVLPMSCWTLAYFRLPAGGLLDFMRALLLFSSSFSSASSIAVALPDLNRQKKCQKPCQIECRKYARKNIRIYANKSARR